MADKPSRALLIYGEGLASSVAHSHTHLHTVASRGCCGFLALDISAPSDTEDERLASELAVLLDAREAHCNDKAEESKSEHRKSFSTLSERFMGMRAALVTDSPVAKSYGEKLGLTTMELEKVSEDKTFGASSLLKLLGFEDSKVLDSCQFDLILVHIGSHLSTNGQSNGVDYANNLVGQILQIAQPGSEIGSRLYLSLVMSYGKASGYDLRQLLPSANGLKNSNLLDLVPRQSYTVKGVNTRNDIRYDSPMLIAQWQEAVTRRDSAQKFSSDEFRQHCGNLAIPADRMLYEIAFKLWKAPKYGA